MDQRTFFQDYIRRWEGGHSVDPADNGNWTGGKQNAGQLVGSNFGVTPAALAAHRKVAVGGITRSIMSALTIDEAVDIASAAYYKAPKLDRLPWNRVTMSIVDMGWGAGPKQAVLLMQRMVGVEADGKIGPNSTGGYNAFILKHGEEAAAWQWAFIRARFYAQITASRPANLKFLIGWLNRTEYFTPVSEWWERAK